ncbi:MAG: tRNA 4-thiouridine(8) synthase ThiI [Christensenellaceae bacterium]|jgi:thiamine biosynthesis protein ThiI|nr:tRNA 4-thiouridine(8) synthase ThiI [Christensenellaceae bacterium]
MATEKGQREIDDQKVALESYDVIVIRYGELFLKGANKSWFESVLAKNIKFALKGHKYDFQRARSRAYIENFENDDIDLIINKLNKVFGIHSLSIAKKIKTDIANIKVLASQISPKNGTFRVTVNRVDNNIKTRSMDIAADIGGYMLSRAVGLKVNLFNHDFELNVDIRENGYSYIFYDKINCAGGLPYSSGGKGMLLLSGGIDSPVAAYMMAKRGVKITAVHFYSFPYTGELALQKVKDLINKLNPYIPRMDLYIVPFSHVQESIDKNCPVEYAITLARRFMMRIAQIIAKKRGCGCLITGESLGQVASQTMESINVTNNVIDLPVLRPLIGLDKSEIVSIAQKIDTYEISIRPFADCCTAFLPDKPVIHPTIDKAIEYETKLNIDELTDKAISEMEIYSIYKTIFN